MLFMATVFLILFLLNLRSRIYFHGSDWSFLFWIFIYCMVTGIGLLKLRKWANVLLFIPGVFEMMIFIYAMWFKHEWVPMPWAFINYGLLGVLIGVPSLMLRYWKELCW